MKRKKYLKRIEKLAKKDYPKGCGMDGTPTKKNCVRLAHEMLFNRRYRPIAEA